MPRGAGVDKKVSRLEDKLKLAGLKTEKKFADLELSMAKVEDKFKDIWEIMPQVSERSEEIENMLEILNLGIRDFKTAVTSLDSRLQSIEDAGVSEDIKNALTSYDRRLLEIKNTLKKLGTDIDIMTTEKNDLVDVVQKDIVPALDSIRTANSENKARVNEIKGLVDEFKLTVKSFEKGMDMIDIKGLISQFTNINTRMAEMQGKVNELTRTQPPELETFVDETRKLKSHLKDTNMRFVENLNRVSDLDAKMSLLDEKIDKTVQGVDNKIQAIDIGRLEKGVESVNDALARFERGKADIDRITTKNERINLELTEKAKFLTEAGGGIENIKSNINKLGELVRNNTSVIDNVRGFSESIDEVKGSISKLQKAISSNTSAIDNVRGFSESIDEVKGSISKIQKAVNTNASNLSSIRAAEEESIKDYTNSLNEARTSIDTNVQMMDEMKSSVSTLQNAVKNIKQRKPDEAMKHFTESLEKINERMSQTEKVVNNVSKEIGKVEQVTELSKMIEELNATMSTRTGELAEKIDLMKATKIPENIGGQLRILKGEVNALISEDRRLRGDIIELQKSRLKSIPPEILTQTLTRVNSLEKKLLGVERSISDDLIAQPVIIE